MLSGVITPNQLFGFLKSGQADGGKSEYNGETQFKFSLWVNEDGSASLSVNDYQPDQQAQPVGKDDDLPLSSKKGKEGSHLVAFFWFILFI